LGVNIRLVIATAHGTAHPDFADLVAQFGRLFGRRRQAGGALAVRVAGEVVVDVWAGYADPVRGIPWTRDTAAVSFSTSKGVAATVVHRLADRGVIAYEAPVARYWPDFAQRGKGEVTVAQLLSHMGGLHRVRGLSRDPAEVRDHHHMAALLAAAPARPHPGTRSGYHALSFGWLVAGLVEHATGEDVRVVLRRELAEPLGADGLTFGAEPAIRHRVARPHPIPPAIGDGLVERLGGGAAALRRTRGFGEAFFAPGVAEVAFSDALLDLCMPAVNGVFTARSLAALYAALADRGVVDGHRLLAEDLVREIGRVRARDRDYVLGWPMRWRMGYHQAFVSPGIRAPEAFGHFGFGGSGAWADPETRTSLAFVTNRVGASTPLGDTRLLRFGATALRTVRAAA
jgi:CubicO group peptidase (beta-lactamase class C family)